MMQKKYGRFFFLNMILCGCFIGIEIVPNQTYVRQIEYTTIERKCQWEKEEKGE